MKEVGFATAVAVGLGGIIGAGIFVLSGTMIGLAGTGALIAFLITGIVAIILAMEMGELTSAMPKTSGASYSFVYNAFGSELGFITGISLYLSFVASISAISLGFGTYLSSMLGFHSTIYPRVLAIALILALMSLSFRGLSDAARADLFIVIFKVGVLVVFIFFAIVFGKELNFNLKLPPQHGIPGIFSAGVIAMFAYAGFQTIATMAPNIKGGGRTAAKAIFAAVLISLVLYVFVTIAMLALVPAARYGFVADPLSFALKTAGAPTWLFYLVDFAALAATVSATLAMIIAGSQLVRQLSADGLLPSVFRKISEGGGSPVIAVFLTSFLGMAIMFAGNIYIIAAISNFGILFSYLMTGFALIKVRRMRSNPLKHEDFLIQAGITSENSFLMPLFPYLPVIGISLLIIFFFGFPTLALSIGIGLILVSLILYYSLREDRDEPVVKVRFFK